MRIHAEGEGFKDNYINCFCMKFKILEICVSSYVFKNNKNKHPETCNM